MWQIFTTRGNFGMNKINIRERAANIWRQSRTDAGKSQDYVAKKLRIAKRTVQNWENGISTPTLDKAVEWFEVIGLQPLPYFLNLLYGDFSVSNDTLTEKEIDELLIKRIKHCSLAAKKKLLFVLSNNHGSSVAGVIEMVTAHLHVPLKDRLNIAQDIILNYEIAESQGKLIQTDNVLPNIELLKLSFDNARNAVLNNKNEYTNTQ